MKHTLTLEFDTLEELQAYLGGAKATTAPGSPRGQGGRSPPPPPPADDADDEITYEEISALVLRVSKEKGRDAAVELLGSFKTDKKKPATKGAEIQPGDYADFKEKAEAVLAEEDLG